MPFTMHIDMLDIYVQPHWILNHLHFNPIQPATPNWELMSLSPLLLYLLVPFFGIAQTLFGSLRYLYDSRHFVPYVAYTPIGTRWENAISIAHDHLGAQFFGVLFIFKLPLLFADFMIAFLLLRLIHDESQATLGFKLWMINPVTIYSIFIWGHTAIIPTLCVVLSLYLAKIKRMLSSFLALGLGTAVEFFPLLFALPHALLVTKNSPRRTLSILLLMGLCLVPYAGITLPFILTGDPSAFATALGTGSQTYLYPISFRLQVNPWATNDWIFLYIIVYAFLVLKASSAPSSEKMWEKMWNLDTMILLSFFALSFFHPYYFIWVSPLIILLLARGRSSLKLYATLTIGWFFYTFYFGRATAMWLFAPISQAFFNLPSPYEIIALLYRPLIVLNVVRSIFSAICLWMVYELLRRKQ